MTSARCLCVVAVLAATTSLAGCRKKAEEAPPEDAGGRATPVDAQPSLDELRGRFDTAESANDWEAAIRAAAELVKRGETEEQNRKRFVRDRNNYGMALRIAGRYDDAVSELERARKEAAELQSDRLLADAFFQLATVYLELRKLDDTIAAATEARALESKLSGPDSEQVETCTRLIASAHDYRQEYEAAEKLFREVVTMAERREGPTSVRVGENLVELAINLNYQRRYGDAEKALLRARPLLKGLEGYDLNTVAELENNLAIIYRGRKEMAEAEKAFARSLEVRTKAVGPGHPLTAIAHHNLARVRLELGKHDAAMSACRQALAIRERSLAPDHPFRQETEAMCREIAEAADR